MIQLALSLSLALALALTLILNHSVSLSLVLSSLIFSLSLFPLTTISLREPKGLSVMVLYYMLSYPEPVHMFCVHAILCADTVPTYTIIKHFLTFFSYIIIKTRLSVITLNPLKLIMC